LIIVAEKGALSGIGGGFQEKTLNFQESLLLIRRSRTIRVAGVRLSCGKLPAKQIVKKGLAFSEDLW
jgi:hypothetical protein